MEDLFKKKIQSFKEWWIKIENQEPSEKVQWYFKKGMEKQLEVREKAGFLIPSEHLFDDDDVLLLDDEHYPSRAEYKDCKRAFSCGFCTDMRVSYV